MKSDSARDPIDRLLRQSLRETAGAPPPDACLEADTLAAWLDGTLTREEAARAEAHAAACDRCQAILSSMARTVPATPERRWLPQLATVRWLVPVATAAAVIALWVSLPSRTMSPVTTRIALGGTDSASAPAASTTAPELEARPPSAAAEPQAAAGSAGRAEPRQSGASQRNPVPPRSAGAADSKLAQPEARRDRANAAGQVDAVATAPKKAADESASPAAAPSLPPAAPAAPPAVSESVAPARVSGYAAGRAGIMRPLEIVSPDPAFRWRPGPDGQVQRSVDGGVTWSPQQTGPTSALLAGSSPSPHVCWVVGRGGTVLLSTDGTTWERRPFPEPVDLVAVRAADARTATVTASSGRQFSTTDGGVTWARHLLKPLSAPMKQVLQKRL